MVRNRIMLSVHSVARFGCKQQSDESDAPLPAKHSSLRIAVNTRLLLHGRLDGWGRFAYEVLKPMVQQHKEHEFIFLFDRAFHEEFIFGDNVTPVVVHPQARHPWLWHVWFEWMLPRVMRSYGADVFLSPDGYLSMNTDVPSLPVIHDLNFLHNPSDIPAHHSAYLNRNFPRFARKATRIATVSEFSKQDIVQQYGIAPEKIDVVYNGVSERFGPTSVIEQAAARQRWTNGASLLHLCRRHASAQEHCPHVEGL
jgi:glycosyltransferase involved in cell wall biosynthesis